MEKVKLLGKSEMKKILGGYVESSNDYCITTLTSPNGQVDQKIFKTQSDIGSSEANAWCVNYIRTHPGSRCGYDCLYDGFGR